MTFFILHMRCNERFTGQSIKKVTIILAQKNAIGFDKKLQFPRVIDAVVAILDAGDMDKLLLETKRSLQGARNLKTK